MSRSRLPDRNLSVAASVRVSNVRGAAPSVNPFEKARIDQIETVRARSPSGRQRVVIPADYEIIDGIHIIFLLFQVERGLCGPPHEFHIVLDLIASHFVN